MSWATAAIVMAAALAAGDAAGGVWRGPDKPPAMVPLGVYWPWERTKPLAQFCKLDKWEYVERAVAVLARHNVNTIWVVNFPIAELVPMLEICHRHGVYLLPGFGEIHYDIDWRHENWAYFDKQLARIAAEVKRSGEAAEHLLGYILCDEPRPQVMDGVEKLRQRFAKIDPRRPAFTVTTWSASPAAVEKTRQPVICVDLYPLFGQDDPNGPHTPEASRSFYTRNLTRLADMLQGTGRALWAMFQCFVEVWGPWKYDDHFRQVALPGAYLHWVCPTPAQMRWQVWEALRCGARGFICFLALPRPPDPRAAQKPAPDVKWKNVLVKKRTVAGPAALLNPDLSETKQLVAMAEAYGSVGRLADVVLRWRRAAKPESIGIKVSGAAWAIFEDPKGRRYAVLVNQDFEKPTRAELEMPAAAAAVRMADAVTGKPMAASKAQGLWVARVALPAGGGAVLAIETPAGR